MWRSVAAVLGVLAVGATSPPASAKQKLTPEQLVQLHLQALTAGSLPPREQTREVKGVVAATMPARAAGLLAGTFQLTSGSTSSRFAMKFDSDLYEGETFTATGNQVEVANAQPRTGSRSAVGNFVSRYRVIVSEGLLGGVLNTRWPLLDVAGRQPKLSYDGVKSLAGRELYRLRYRAKENQGGLDVELYFDPKTYRHAATVYSTSQAQGLGATPEASSQEADMHFRIEERFGRFEEVGGMILPKSWSLRYERTGNTANEWKYDLTVQTLEVAGPQALLPHP
jgi:hypothetical protein